MTDKYSVEKQAKPWLMASRIAGIALHSVAIKTAFIITCIIIASKAKALDLYIPWEPAS